MKKSIFHAISDADLLALYQNEAARGAVEELWSRYRHLLYGEAYFLLKNETDAEDALQFAAQQLLEAKNEVLLPKKWLFAIVKNFCLKKIKSTKNSIFIDIENSNLIENETSFVQNEGFTTLIDNETTEALQQAMARLPDEQRLCLHLFYWENLSFKQIAQKTNYDLNLIRSYLQNGKRNLRNLLSPFQ